MKKFMIMMAMLIAMGFMACGGNGAVEEKSANDSTEVDSIEVVDSLNADSIII